MTKKVCKCDCNIIHQEIVDSAIVAMPEYEKLCNLAEFFKVLGDSTRTRILSALDLNEMCVCDLANLLNMTKSAISHQLKFLKRARLVKNRKHGKEVFYSFDDAHIKEIFESALNHISEVKNEK